MSMKFGVLSDYFDGAGAKRLTEVEINRRRSNQHEFQGVGVFRRFMGETDEKERFPATFYWLDDTEDGALASSTSFCTWSNVRKGKRHRAPEYHLYYAAESEEIVRRATAGDLLVVARTAKPRLHVMLCPADTTIALQLLWLFGLTIQNDEAEARLLPPDEGIRLGHAARAVLEVLGIRPPEPEQPEMLESMISRFESGFPRTEEFSAFARETMPGIDPVGSPDEALVAWMDQEEALFFHLERHTAGPRLAEGFIDAQGSPDFDGFFEFALSTQNRRKSRAGHAFGHHVEAILQAHGIRYTREATTEKRFGPDFLFPGETEYHDPVFDVNLLTMLGVKTSCKERWRQVLAEANKIREKHLLTLEPGISETQTNEMKTGNLRLVVPRSIFVSYTPEQQRWLMDVADFIGLVKDRQI